MNTEQKRGNYSKVIVVTGASGYIGGHTIRLLLDRGYRVRGIVRDLSKADKLAFLRDLPRTNTPDGKDPLELVAADLQAGQYGTILQGAHALIHTATPYFYTADDPQKEIVDPAVNGTVDAIKGALQANVRRVVITSSGGAVFDLPPTKPAGTVYTEKDWNSTSSLTNNPYFYSKRLAEQAAWKMWEEHKDRLDLAVVNPSFVIGPPQSPILQSSLTTFKRYLLGELEKPMPGQAPWVDVRDVALAHVLAMEQDAAIGHRVFCTCETRPWRDLSVLLRQLYPEYPGIKDLDVNTGIHTTMDTSLVQSMGLAKFIPFEQMVKDTVDQFIKLGVVESLRK